MNDIFKESNLAGIKLKNKIIRSATHEGLADENGFPTEKLKNLYINLAKNNVGAIITGYAGVNITGKSFLHNMLMIDDDNKIRYYKEITDAVHEYNTPIILQIAHCGNMSSSKSPVVPSAIKNKIIGGYKPKEISDKEIEETIDDFVKAVVRAKKSNFDGVQLHCAHGYFLSLFLSSYSNRRRDKWGGSTENKYRIIDEIIKRAKKEAGDYPVLAKINAHDNLKNGMRVNEAIKIAGLFEKSGIDALEISCGSPEGGFYTIRGDKNPIDAIFKYMAKYKNIPKIFRSPIGFIVNMILPPVKPVSLYNVEAASMIKKAVNIPVIVVGGIKSIEDIKYIINEKKLDFVSMCRPFIIEQNIVNKFINGTQTESKCINCNTCAIAQEVRSIKCYYGKV